MVGDLRRVLSDPALDDSTPIQVALADAPGDFSSYGTRVVVSAERDGVIGADGTPGLRSALLLLADFPDGEPTAKP
ncbi:DUF6225 family protein [Streptomyces sp. C10-9-1]|uniref:DUF6225 family protein n=1 Tax=Streptomyces sp. C10-9-1 TaxID=1859285 RepID=UPI003D71902E